MFEAELASADPNVIGPRPSEDAAPRLWRETTVETDGTWHSFVVFSPPDGDFDAMTVEVVPCSYDGLVLGDGLTAEGADIASTLEEWGSWTIALDMPPGRYVVRLSRRAESPGTVALFWAASN